jgi:DNA-binding PadR family transcriptional regulator
MAVTITSQEFVSQSEMRTRVLTILSRSARTPTEIGKLENKHVSHVCRTIKELEAQGLVEVAWSESGEKGYRATRSGYALLTLLPPIPTKESHQETLIFQVAVSSPRW